MNQVVVAKKVRLLTKDGNSKLFVKDKQEVIRDRAVIFNETVEESEETYPYTGVLWVIDEEATTERNNEIEGIIKPRPKNKKTKNEESTEEITGQAKESDEQ